MGRRIDADWLTCSLGHCECHCHTVHQGNATGSRDIQNGSILSGQPSYKSCEKHESLSLRLSLSTGHHLPGVRPIRSLKSNVCTALTRQNTTALTRQNTTALTGQNTTALTGQNTTALTRQNTTHYNCTDRTHKIQLNPCPICY
jgi:hypothetical protein